MAEPVTVERRGHVQVITITRPEVRNALNGAAARALAAAADELDGDPDLRVGVLTGAGGTFCAGTSAWQRQEELYKPVFASADAREGAAAFAEKRPSAWRGI